MNIDEMLKEVYDCADLNESTFDQASFTLSIVRLMLIDKKGKRVNSICADLGHLQRRLDAVIVDEENKKHRVAS